ncbi:MAG: type II secretion system GspH family protein [Puniceicoccales bacterium]|jgi:type II secretory pathway pseudopilin PulG|nr:type II secretion system GspH family protein [Puniceicoccales bacterium]
MGVFSHKNFSSIGSLNTKISNYSGFTAIEIVCTISIFLIIVAGILKIQQSFQGREKQIRTRTEMTQIAGWLEEYRSIHGDYPKIVSHNDYQGSVLCSALHGNIDPDGIDLDITKKIDLVTTSLQEIDGKFVDPFLSDYIYYYKLRMNNLWKNPSYILISKGPKGQQNPQRDLIISTNITISPTGKVDGNPNGDIVLTDGGFL